MIKRKNKQSNAKINDQTQKQRIKRQNKHSNAKINNQNVCVFGSVPFFPFKKANAKINSQTQNK